MKSQSIRQFDPINDDAWDRLALTHSESSYFHSASWAQVLYRTYGHRPHYLGAFDETGVQSLLPLMEVDSSITGRRGVLLPFADECPPLSWPNASLQPLHDELRSLGKDRRWRYIELRGCGSEDGDSRPAPTFVGHNLELSQGPEAIYSGFHSSVRRAIRKAERAGVTVKFAGTLDAVQTYYLLHCRTRRRLGVPPQPFRFFRNLHEFALARGTGIVATARLNGTPIAAAMFLGFGGNATFKFGASDESFQSLRGNDMLMWEAIKWHIARGFSRLSFGRTEPANEGLRRFKRGFGALEYPIHYSRYDFRTGVSLDLDPAPPKSTNLCFKYIPTSILRVVGAAAYPHIS